jgi:phosphate transport system substrate-binding protein
MHDEFLHRLRKDPPPGFAARLQAQLRRQSRLSRRIRPRPLLRTLITVLMLGGAAFAVTWIVMRGLPSPVEELYHPAAGRAAGERTAPSARTAGGAGSQWSAPAGATPSAEPAHSPRAAAGAAPSARSSATAGSSVSIEGAPSASQGMQIRAVSSWSAYPYAAAFAEHVNRGFPGHIGVSIVDSNGVMASLLCGASAQGPDVAFTFAPVGAVSGRPCPPDASGLPSPVVAIPIDYEAVALARSPLYGALDLTRREVFLALAKWVPDPSRPGALRENPNTVWRQIDPSFGPEPIEFLGPALSSPAGRSIISLLVQGGCDTYPWIAALKATHPRRYARICRTVRTDGVYTEVSGDEPATLLSKPNAVGILPFWSLTHSPQKDLSVSKLDGVRPTPQSIASGSYPGSRELYVCFNRQRTNMSVMLRLVLVQPPPWDSDWALIPLLREERLAAFRDAFTH